MLKNDIYLCILDVFKKCNIKSFPLDCIDILENYGYKAIPYSSMTEIKRDACMQLSEDACVIKNNVYYNDLMPEYRIRFSLMHELGHIILNTTNETTANYFASNILAPRMAIYYAKCKNEVDVSKLFKLTKEAALIAFNDYKRWYRHITYFKMSSHDKELYNHFFNETQHKFIYSIKPCNSCSNEIFNSNKSLCTKCEHLSNLRFNMSYIHDSEFIRLENSWLFNGI